MPIALLVPAVWSAGHGPNGRDEFQQGVRYEIEALLDEEVGLLRAAAILTYTNRSADTLDALYLHLHLNAFRPNSLWARTEQRPAYDFQALEEPDYAFERLLGASIEGRQLAARFPGAPDSTVVELTLPSPLVPGDEVRVDLRWEARPSTLCRRQCRSGRHYDFAQWYPRIAVYDEQGWQPHPLRASFSASSLRSTWSWICRRIRSSERRESRSREIPAGGPPCGALASPHFRRPPTALSRRSPLQAIWRARSLPGGNASASTRRTCTTSLGA
jgi:hypothetical protein